MLNKTGKITKKDVAVIGSGFAGMAASAVLAANGTNVTVFEKNAKTGGRARSFE
ncbi:MAG: FAD-dependent oxidoreductase, partial [Dyadobacter sp.]